MLCFVPWRQVFFHHVFQKSSLERDGKDPVRAPGCTQAGGQMLGHLRTWGALRGGEGSSGLSLAAWGGSCSVSHTQASSSRHRFVCAAHGVHQRSGIVGGAVQCQAGLRSRLGMGEEGAALWAAVLRSGAEALCTHDIAGCGGVCVGGGGGPDRHSQHTPPQAARTAHSPRARSLWCIAHPQELLPNFWPSLGPTAILAAVPDTGTRRSLRRYQRWMFGSGSRITCAAWSCVRGRGNYSRARKHCCWFSPTGLAAATEPAFPLFQPCGPWSHNPGLF